MMIDASHGNSSKRYENQPGVVDAIAQQIEAGDSRIGGLMVESHLVAGRQDLVPGKPLVYGQSITDACIDWDTSVRCWIASHRRSSGAGVARNARRGGTRRYEA